MAMSIFKYELPVAESFMLPGHHDELLMANVQAPYDAQVLSVDEQHGKPVVWMKVPYSHSTTPLTTHKFVMLATGAILSDEAQRHLEYAFRFVGTIKLNGGHFILHVFAEQ